MQRFILGQKNNITWISAVLIIIGFVSELGFHNEEIAFWSWAIASVLGIIPIAIQAFQALKVKVISIDEDKKRIGLSIRQLEDDPWAKKVENLKVGMLVEAVITNLTKFGAFAKVQDDIEGLVHISELSDAHITHPKEVLHEGEKVTLRIIKIEPDSHRIGLSLRRVESAAYADMDMKLLKQELENSDIHVSTPDESDADQEDATDPAE